MTQYFQTPSRRRWCLEVLPCPAWLANYDGVEVARIRQCAVCKKIFWAYRFNVLHCRSDKCTNRFNVDKFRGKEYTDRYKINRIQKQEKRDALQAARQ